MLSVTGAARWCGLVVVLLVGVGAAGWGLWDLYRAPDRADLTGYWQLVVAVAALVVAGLPLVRDLRATRTRDGDSGGELDRLADAVRLQWEQAATARGLLHPEP